VKCTTRNKKFGKTFEEMEGFYTVISATGLNTRNDDYDDEE
jgi:hypothetical protein